MKTRQSSTPTAGRPLGAVMALAVVLALSGCASPYAPPITVLEPPEAAVRPPELAHAMAVARQQIASYRAKVVELGESERHFSNGVFGLGTVILGLAAANTHSSAIRGAVLGTGAVYAAGELNTDQRRGEIYLAGIGALECALTAVGPLSLNAETEAALRADRARIRSLVSALTAAEGHALAKATLAPLLHPKRFEATVREIQAAVVAAQAARDAASQADQLTRQRLEVPTVSAVALRNAVDGIDREVLKQLEITRPSLQSIPAQLAQLQASTLFSGLAGLPADAGSPVPSPAKSTGAPHSALFGEDAAGLQAAAAAQLQLARELASALGQLRTATSDVQAMVKGTSASVDGIVGKVAEALAACQVAGVVQPLSVAQPSVSIPVGKALIEQVFVQGGNGLLRPGFTRKPVPGLTVSAPPGTTGLVEIQATEQTVAGTYPLVVEDTTMTSRVSISVVVAAAEPASTPPPAPADATQAALLAKALKAIPAGTVITLADGTAEVKKSFVLPSQAGIEVEYSTTSPTATPEQVEEAIKALTEIANLGATVRIQASRVASDAPHAARFNGPAVLAGAKRAEVELLQARLCMAPADQDGRWGPATQRALMLDRAQRDSRQPPQSGPLTLAEHDQLLALSPAQAAARCAQRTGR